MEDYEQANAVRRGFRLIKSSEQGFNFGLINWMMMIFMLALVVTGISLIFK